MSLVNDMLLDLDERQGSRERQAQIGLEPAPAARTSSWQLVVLAVAGLLLVLTGAVAFQFMVTSGDSSAAMADEISGKAIAVPESPAESRPALPSSALELGSLESVPDQAAVPERPDETDVVAPAPTAAPLVSAVAPLLAAAERALAEDRLTQPPAHNAHALYRHVLMVEPDNRQAQAGIERIQQRYEQMIRAAIDKRNWTDGLSYLRRAELVAMPPAQVAALREALQQARAAPSSGPEAAEEAVAAAPAPAQSDAGGEAGKGTMALSWRSREANALRRANDLLARGEQVQAVRTLQEVVEAYPQAESAAVTLFDLHLAAGATAEIQRLQRRAESPHLRAYYRARLLVDAGHHDEALQVLEQQIPRGRLQQPYSAVQAALYQRSGRFEDAARLYQHLVELDQRQPNYWLGLGVAMEALGQRKQALRAFAAAEQLAPPDPTVRSYIKERIEALTD